MNTIRLASHYELKLDEDDYNRLKTVKLNLSVNKDYTKIIISEDGVLIKDLLGLPSNKFTFADGDDLNYTDENLEFIPDPTKF